MSKLSDDLIKALVGMGEEFGFGGWPDEAEAVIDGIKALEAQLVQMTAERDTWRTMAQGMPEEVVIDMRKVAAKARHEALREAAKIVTDAAHWSDCDVAIQALIDAEGGDT